MVPIFDILKLLVIFRGDAAADQLWIGLHDRDHESTCSCLFVTLRECAECRDRFVWVDETPVDEDYAPWSGSEPGTGEKCVRLTYRDTNQRWAASPCSIEIDYVCSKGIKRHPVESFPLI